MPYLIGTSAMPRLTNSDDGSGDDRRSSLAIAALAPSWSTIRVMMLSWTGW
jgi:hypothetical protein